MEIKTSTELLNYIMLEDIQSHDPTSDPFVFIAKSFESEFPNAESDGQFSETILIETFLVPISQKDRILGKFHYGDTPFSGKTYFDPDGTYQTGETYDEGEISFEIIVNEMTFPSLNLAYFEPTDRLIKYLNLHRTQNTWINPYDKEEIIKKAGESRGFDPHDTYLTIRKSELKDYLAARKCGLLILRYAQRNLVTPNLLTRIPEPFISKRTRNGHLSFFIDKSTFEDDKNSYYSRLWDTFWIDPASAPRRGDARRDGEFKDGVQFTLDDGEKVTYRQDGVDRYFKILSFNPTVINALLSKVNHSMKFHCLSNFCIVYPDGYLLECCVNKEGQIQSFFGQVTKLSLDKQQFLSGYSESQKAKMSPEYFRTHIESKFPCTWPWDKTLSECIRVVNDPWIKRFGMALLCSPTKDEIAINMRFGPATNTDEELIDIMLEFQKILIPEGKIDKIKAEFDCSSFLPKGSDYSTVKSIGYTQLLFKQNLPGNVEGHSQVLRIINELRNCKGHPKNVEEILSKYGYAGRQRREVFYKIMAEFCSFLLGFKTITEKLFCTTFPPAAKKVEDPWVQLQFARKYFANPF